MQIHYALYERLKDGYGWSWYSSELPEPLRNDFFHRITQPNDSNKIELGDLRGGIYRFDKWTILYRFFNGGKDAGGRPNRNVMLTAWISTQDLVDRNVDLDLLKIFRNEIFQWVLERSKKIGIDPPSTLNETIYLSEPLTEINAAYKDFLRNLDDKYNDYDLRINNEQFTLEKKPPKDKEDLGEEHGNPESRIQHVPSGPQPPESPQKTKFSKFVVVVVALFAVSVIYIKPPVSPRNQQIIELYLQLTVSEQKELLDTLFQKLPRTEQKKLLDTWNK